MNPDTNDMMKLTGALTWGRRARRVLRAFVAASLIWIGYLVFVGVLLWLVLARGALFSGQILFYACFLCFTGLAFCVARYAAELLRRSLSEN